MTQFGVGLVVRGTAPVGNYPTIDSDEIDRAAARTEGLISFARAKKVADANASFNDRLLVPVSKFGTGAVRTASDSVFNNKPSININLNDRQAYRLPLLATPSFTFLAVVRKLADDVSGNFFGSGAGFVSYFTSTSCVIQPNWDNRAGGANDFIAPITPALNETAIWWLSFDNAAKTIRLGKNSATPLVTSVSVNAHVADGATHRFQPFSFRNQTNPAFGTDFLRCKWGSWALFDRAYGAGGVADANFADLIEAAKSHYAIA